MLWALEVCIVVIGSLVPDRVIPFDRLPNDKVLHFAGYFVAGALAPFAFERIRSWVSIAVALIGLGVVVEYAQRAMSLGRSWDPHDMLANTLGVISGLALGLLLQPATRGLWAKLRGPIDPL